MSIIYEQGQLYMDDTENTSIIKFNTPLCFPTIDSMLNSLSQSLIETSNGYVSILNRLLKLIKDREKDILEAVRLTKVEVNKDALYITAGDIIQYYESVSFQSILRYGELNDMLQSSIRSLLGYYTKYKIITTRSIDLIIEQMNIISKYNKGFIITTKIGENDAVDNNVHTHVHLGRIQQSRIITRSLLRSGVSQQLYDQLDTEKSVDLEERLNIEAALSLIYTRHQLRDV